MLLKAVKAFPELFYVKNFKFDLEDPDFVFEYRDRAFNIPPWEEVKFYRDVDLTEDLITFFKPNANVSLIASPYKYFFPPSVLYKEIFEKPIE